MGLEQTTGRAPRTLSQLNRWMTVGLVLFLAILPFHLVVKRLVPDPVGTYWKEFLLALLVTLWLIQCLRSRRLLLSGTPLDWAVLAYLGLLLLRFALDGSGWTGTWGLYVSVMYLPLFWLVTTVLRHHRHLATLLLGLLVGIGGVVALGGLVEFILDVSLWPSDEITRRLGHPDFYIYGTHVRRVYFTFDSPTALANTLALLLPQALALLTSSVPLEGKRRYGWTHLTAGLAAALMAVCIIFTFSRGIWVATTLALLAMGLLNGTVRRNWRILLAVTAILVLSGLIWILVTVIPHEDTTPTTGGVIELSPEAYWASPVTRVHQELLHVEPARGKAVTQTWTLVDPISGQNDTRLVLYEHPPESGKEEIIYRVQVPETGALRFAIALSPEVWSPKKGDGATFQVYIATPSAPQAGQFAFVRYINPKDNPSDRRWRNFLVDLSSWAGRTVNLSLIIEGGPADDWAFDWGGWSELEVVSIEPGTFASARSENAVLRHSGSILDWVRDETNRDRLAAWSLSIDAWRAAPIWGTGLGSTGVAALRTQPERAFVTESQVLKALVELGLPGVLALAFLWVQIARVGYGAFRRTSDPMSRMLLTGILTGLLVILIEGWVYQNLEVKQVNAYFWTLVGLLAFLATVHDERG